MIYAIGDSHSDGTFRGIPGTTHKCIGAVTLKRVGYLEDTLLPEWLAKWDFQPEDYCVFCFGEIDSRCHIKLQLENRPHISLHDFVSNWVERYLLRLSTLDTGPACKCVLSVVPPTTVARSGGYYEGPFSVRGTDEERVEYAQKFNELLSSGCQKYNLLYLDVYSRYKDERGMLLEEKSDGGIHINEQSAVKELLLQLGMLTLET